jgi:quinol monooxygenase YgiN
MEGTMSELALVAEFQVGAQGLELFMAAAKREMRAVRASEPGCVGFDVVLFDEAIGRGAFVEVFEDQAAVDAHRETPHFSAFFEKIADLEVTWAVRRGTAVSVE